MLLINLTVRTVMAHHLPKLRLSLQTTTRIVYSIAHCASGAQRKNVVVKSAESIVYKKEAAFVLCIKQGQEKAPRDKSAEESEAWLWKRR
jgi:hypothetical protein